MNGTDIYNNVCVEIDMLENVLENVRAEIITLQRKMYKPPVEIKSIEYSGMPKGSADHTSFDRLYERLVRLIGEEENYSISLESKKKLKKTLIDQYREITGLENKVQYLRDVRGLGLQQIAEELGYAIQSIKNISCKIPKNKK